MTLPVKPVSRPEVLRNQPNGRLPNSILLDTPGQQGGSTVRLVEPAARAWRALCAAALKDGHVLKATSAMDSYRPYAEQERIFYERYSKLRIADRPTKRWNGITYWLRPRMATAAVPGTSNHGFGLAVDTGEERDSDPGAESLDRPTLDWLLGHADKFGFSWEVQSEPWHIRYYAGDKIPSAVLLYEHENTVQPNQDEENDVLPSDVTAKLKAPNGGFWLLHYDGGVTTHGTPEAPFYGSYPGLPASAKQDADKHRGFFVIEARADGGYDLTSTDGGTYSFPKK